MSVSSGRDRACGRDRQEDAVKSFADWSIRYKLLTVLLLLGIAPFAATVTMTYLECSHALEQAVTNQLAGVRRSKASRIETYYRTIQSHVLTLSEDRMFIEAMREFHRAYELLNAQPAPSALRESVLESYRSRFYPQMQQAQIARPRVEDYLPVTPAALRLQLEYIVN